MGLDQYLVVRDEVVLSWRNHNSLHGLMVSEWVRADQAGGNLAAAPKPPKLHLHLALPLRTTDSYGPASQDPGLSASSHSTSALTQHSIGKSPSMCRSAAL